MRKLLAKLGISIVALACVAGCATPERTVTVRTWSGDQDNTRTLSMTHEIGYQLFFGARSTLLTGPGASAVDSVDKTAMADVAKTAIGAALGAYLGGLPGAVAGGATGAAVGPVTRVLDRSSTETLPLAVPALK